MHVPAAIRRRNRYSRGYCLASRQVSVTFLQRVPCVLLHWNVQSFKDIRWFPSQSFFS